MTQTTLRNGNNVPIHAPLFDDPFVPYRCPGNATLSVYCRGDRDALAAHLVNTPFVLASDVFLVYVSDFTNCDKVAFMDAGIMLAVTHKGRPGGYVLYEYEDDDAAMAAGRELWGYPKKLAHMELSYADEAATARIVRKGREIVSLRCDFSPSATTTDLQLSPHFNLKVTPGPRGEVVARQVIERDTSPDFKTISNRTGTGSATLSGTALDPFDRLGPFQAISASYLVGDFLSSEENGWGKVIDVL